MVKDGQFEISVKYQMREDEKDFEEEAVRSYSIPWVVHSTKTRRVASAFKVTKPATKLFVKIKTVHSGYFLGFEDIIS